VVDVEDAEAVVAVAADRLKDISGLSDTAAVGSSSRSSLAPKCIARDRDQLPLAEN
jgi:hypothetical protein